jgi:hypothetical protein
MAELIIVGLTRTINLAIRSDFSCRICNANVDWMESGHEFPNIKLVTNVKMVPEVKALPPVGVNREELLRNPIQKFVELLIGSPSHLVLHSFDIKGMDGLGKFLEVLQSFSFEQGKCCADLLINSDKRSESDETIKLNSPIAPPFRVSIFEH